MAYNSDGYILVDFSDVDFRRTNQTIEGIFERLRLVIGTNKFVLVINANGRSPLPSTVSITNGQYVIESCIYTFSIAANDNLHIKRNDVPASDIIDDSTISADKAWSSYKVNEELATKADTSALADYQPLLTAGTNITIDENNVISASDTGAVIDDTTTALDKVWSSQKVSNELSTKANTSALSNYQPLLTAGDNITIDSSNEISADVSAVINDTTASATTTYSSDKVDSIINGVKIKSFTYTGTGNATNYIIFPSTPTLVLGISGSAMADDSISINIMPFLWGVNWAVGITGYVNLNTNGVTRRCNITYDGNTASLYSSSQFYNANVLNKTYAVYYI